MGLYLVTGGAGFIGSSIARALLARGDGVRIIDNFSSGKRENLADFADRHRAHRGRHPRREPLARATERRRGRVPRGGDPVGAAVDGRSAREPRRQRDRHAARARGGAQRGRAPRRLRGVVGGLRRRRRRCPRSRPCAPAPLSPYGGGKLAGEHYCRSSRAPTGSRRSACATSTCSARARIRSRSTRR